ncbi:hypothetical protein [Streptomyces sp. NPDC058718]|uniref:hypothetical protein n=1 Tax=Streptomyces sp. NPDC058718 TaxID=3346610 RepID=UPI0036C246BE
MSEDAARWYRGRLVMGPFRPFEPSEVERLERAVGLGPDDGDEYGWGTLLGEYCRSRDGRLADEAWLDGLLPIARNGGSDVLFLDVNPAT